MTYPASPSDAGANRVRLDFAQFWAGTGATAVVAALVAAVGILVCRWTLNIPILAPAGDGAWGNAHSLEYALVAALVAIIAGGLLCLLVLAAQPRLFFNWIMGLATLAAVVYPFSTSATLDQKAATAIVNLVLGIAITSLLTAVLARSIRRPVVRRPPYGGGRPGYAPEQRYPPDQRYIPDPRYGPEQGQGSGREYPQDVPPTTRPIFRPTNVPPQDGDARRE